MQIVYIKKVKKNRKMAKKVKKNNIYKVEYSAKIMPED